MSNMPVADNPRLALSNKLLITVKYSQDGRCLESFKLDYDPVGIEIFLIENILNSSEFVESYSMFDSNGLRIKEFNTEKYNKRV